MAKITDPDALSQGVEVVFDTALKTIELLTAGNLSADGVTLQALYSFCKEEWKSDANLIKLPFCLEAITEVKFDLINGWDFKNQGTRNLIRDGGWSLRNVSGVSQEEYFGFVTLGTFAEGTDRAYYQQSAGGAPANAVYAGPVNEPVKIYGDATHGSVNLRSVFQAFLREQGKTYSGASLADQSVTAIDYTVYKLPLSNASDPKITASDVTISANTPYTGMTIDYRKGNGFGDWVSAGSYAIADVRRDTTVSPARWFKALTAHSGVITAPNLDATNWVAYAGERQIGTNWYAFNVIVGGNSAVAEKIYEFTQYKNRQATDINGNVAGDNYGAVTGKTAAQLLSFLGDTLITGRGVYIDAFDSNDTNRIEFTDVGGTKRTFPYVAAGAINFNDNLQNDPDAKYFMYFSNDDGGDNTGRDFGTTTAILVNDNDGLPISGTVAGQASISFTYDYDGNVQRGATSAGTDAPITLVAVGLGKAQYVKLSGTITRAVGQSFTLVASLERNYSNAV